MKSIKFAPVAAATVGLTLLHAVMPGTSRYAGGATVIVQDEAPPPEDPWLNADGYGPGGADASPGDSAGDGGGGGGGGNESNTSDAGVMGPAAKTKEAQTDCLKGSLAKMDALKAKNTSRSNYDIASKAAVENSCDNIEKCDNAMSVSKLTIAIMTQVAKSNIVFDPTNKMAVVSQTINLPEATIGKPYILDPNAEGSLANLATKNRLIVIQMAKSSPEPGAKAFAKAVINGETGYKAFVSVVMGSAFVEATKWDDATCREWVINHERSHGILADTSKHGRSDGPRTAELFDESGTPNPDGLALLMTVADQGKSQNAELRRIGAELMKAGESNGAGRCVDGSKKIEC